MKTRLQDQRVTRNLLRSPWKNEGEGGGHAIEGKKKEKQKPLRCQGGGRKGSAEKNVSGKKRFFPCASTA